MPGQAAGLLYKQTPKYKTGSTPEWVQKPRNSSTRKHGNSWSCRKKTHSSTPRCPSRPTTLSWPAGAAEIYNIKRWTFSNLFSNMPPAFHGSSITGFSKMLLSRKGKTHEGGLQRQFHRLEGEPPAILALWIWTRVTKYLESLHLSCNADPIYLLLYLSVPIWIFPFPRLQRKLPKTHGLCAIRKKLFAIPEIWRDLAWDSLRSLPTSSWDPSSIRPTTRPTNSSNTLHLWCWAGAFTSNCPTWHQTTYQPRTPCINPQAKGRAMRNSDSWRCSNMQRGNAISPG